MLKVYRINTKVKPYYTYFILSDIVDENLLLIMKNNLELLGFKKEQSKDLVFSGYITYVNGDFAFNFGYNDDNEIYLSSNYKKETTAYYEKLEKVAYDLVDKTNDVLHKK